MNKKNARLLIKDLKNGTKDLYGRKVVFDMDRWGMEVYNRSGNPCGTAYCIGGHVELRLMKASDTGICIGAAKEWLGITDEQETELFLPKRLAVRRMNGTTLDKDIWGNIIVPLRLKGAKGAKYAIRAIERAMKLWGAK